MFLLFSEWAKHIILTWALCCAVVNPLFASEAEEPQQQQQQQQQQQLESVSLSLSPRPGCVVVGSNRTRCPPARAPDTFPCMRLVLLM